MRLSIFFIPFFIVLLITGIAVFIFFSGSNPEVLNAVKWLFFSLWALCIIMLIITMKYIKRWIGIVKLREEFLSTVSHQIKTPLTTIRMFARTLKEGRIKSKEKIQEYYDIIWKESVLLSNLVENILDFSRIDDGIKKYPFSLISIEEIYERVKESIINRYPNRVNLSLEGDKRKILKGNLSALLNAITNLVDNAVKFSEKKVDCLFIVRGAMLEIKVIDRGPGIPPEYQKKIFERFYRAPNIRKPGAGLGLSIVKHIVKLHKGDIKLESNPGKTVFSIYLPLKK